jgi:hypothetical protein
MADWAWHEAPNLHVLQLHINALTGFDLAVVPNVMFFQVSSNRMTDPDDVLGWRERGLRIDAIDSPGMGFWPQHTDNPLPPRLAIGHLDDVVETAAGAIVLPTATFGQPFGNDTLPWGDRGIDFERLFTGTKPLLAIHLTGNYPAGAGIRETPPALLGIASAPGAFQFPLRIENQFGVDPEDSKEDRVYIISIRPAGFVHEPTAVRIVPRPATGFAPGDEHVPEFRAQVGSTVRLFGLVSDQYGAPIPYGRVTWQVQGNQSAGTAVSPAGILAIAADETATSITVRADATEGGIYVISTVRIE